MNLPRIGICLLCTLLACSPGRLNTLQSPASPAPIQIAFLADVHLQDVYGQLGDFAGLPNSRSHKNATIRTMYAQLTSTRLFNENYFVLRAALDDVVRRGVRYVALPGDYTDDGQPINVNGLRTILREYQAQGVRFFIAPGNHDPNKPFAAESGKTDFLGAGGRNQRIHSMNDGPCRGKGLGHVPDPQHPGGPEIVCTDQIKEGGYAELLPALAEFGYMPQPSDLYWESPFSTGYGATSYSYDAARQQADLAHRQYEICHEGEGGAYKQTGYTSCALVADASYLVEPVAGVWLLAIDANVYQPKAGASFFASHPSAPSNYEKSGNAGYNHVLTHKRHLVAWIADVVRRARAQDKQLISFAHFPLSEFYNGQSDNIQALFGASAFAVARRPLATTTAALAATGLRLHIGGHMHLNNTGIYPAGGGRDARGNFLVNIQAPSLGVFGAAYKLVTILSRDLIDVQTVVLKDVPRWNELFEHYEMEWQRLSKSTDPEDAGHLWKHEVLDARSFQEFTHAYFGELSRLRLLDENWPCTLKEVASHLDGAQLLILSQLRTQVTLAQLKEVPDVVPLTARCTAPGKASAAPVAASQLRADFAAATDKARQLAVAAGLTLLDFAQLSPYELSGDFIRTLYAGELALRDMGDKRVRLYRVLMSAFPAQPAAILRIGDRPSDQNPVHVVFQSEWKQVFRILQSLGTGNPSDHFTIDYQNATVKNAGPEGLSFK